MWKAFFLGDNGPVDQRINQVQSNFGPAERRGNLLSWLLAAPLEAGDGLAEKMNVGLQVTVTGVLVVFTVLILLYFLLVLLGRLFAESPRPPAPSPPPVPAPPADGPSLATPAKEGTTAPTTADGVGGETLAAIGAALAVALAPAGPNGQLAAPVRPAKTSGWAMAGRIDQMTARERLPHG